jgi:hypothetical protein
MAVGQATIGAVAGLLSFDVGKTIEQIHADLPRKVSPRAIRYAVTALHKDCRVLRRGELIFLAPAEASIAEHEKEAV